MRWYARLAVGLNVGSSLQHCEINSQCSSFSISAGRFSAAVGFCMRKNSTASFLGPMLIHGSCPVNTYDTVRYWTIIHLWSIHLKKYWAVRIHIAVDCDLQRCLLIQLLRGFPPDVPMSISCQASNPVKDAWSAKVAYIGSILLQEDIILPYRLSHLKLSEVNSWYLQTSSRRE